MHFGAQGFVSHFEFIETNKSVGSNVETAGAGKTILTYAHLAFAGNYDPATFDDNRPC